MKKVFICSKLRGKDKYEMERNIEEALQHCKLAISKGFMPLAPHIYFTRFLNDNILSERMKGMAMGIRWLMEADELWVFGDNYSIGMQKEINYAIKHKIKIKKFLF